MMTPRLGLALVIAPLICVIQACDPGQKPHAEGQSASDPSAPTSPDSSAESALSGPKDAVPGDEAEPAGHPASGRVPIVLDLADAPRRTAPNGAGRATLLTTGEQAFMARLVLEPNAKIPEHRDETEEYIHVLSGGGTMFIDDQRYEVKSGTTVYMPANAKVSFENSDVPMVALQVFAAPGPEKKYEKWLVSSDEISADGKRCRELSDVYCEPPDEATESPTIEFSRLSLERQATWLADCERRVSKFDDEQKAQFDQCVGCVANCEDAGDCMRGIDMCDL